MLVTRPCRRNVAWRVSYIVWNRLLKLADSPRGFVASHSANNCAINDKTCGKICLRQSRTRSSNRNSAERQLRPTHAVAVHNSDVCWQSIQLLPQNDSGLMEWKIQVWWLRVWGYRRDSGRGRGSIFLRYKLASRDSFWREPRCQMCKDWRRFWM